MKADRLRFRNPDGIGVMSVRYRPGSDSGWLVTAVGSRKRESTGIPWPQNDGSKKNRHGMTSAQQHAYDRGIKILKARALAFTHPEAYSRQDDPTTRTLTLYQAIEDFKKSVGFDKLPRGVRVRYSGAISHFLIGPGYGDMPLEYSCCDGAFAIGRTNASSQ